MNDKMSGSLRLPLQAAPIDRTSSAAALNGSGIEASWGWGDVWNVVKDVAGPALTAAAPTILGAI
jgi:hypothetical protein